MYRNYFYREDLKVELTQLEEEDEKVKVNGEVEVQRGKKLYDGDVVEALGETIKIVK